MSRLSRSIVLVLGLVAALLALGVGGAAPVRATSAYAWGFAYLDNPHPISPYTPDLAHQAGSWQSSPSCGHATVNYITAGTYEVDFPCIFNTNGIPHVTAVNSQGVWCQIARWRPADTGAGLAIDVLCFARSSGGASAPPPNRPQDSRFVVMFTRSSGSPTPPGGGYAYASYDHVSKTLVDQYNSAGGADSITPLGPGQWAITLDKLGPTTYPTTPYSGSIQATAVGTQAARCKVGYWVEDPTMAVQSIWVTCFDAASNPLDTSFTLSYQRERDILGRVPHNFAYYLDPGAPAGTGFNSGAFSNSLTITPPAKQITFHGIGKLQDHIQVTAEATTGLGDPDYCQPTDLWTTKLDVVVPVECFDATAKPDPAGWFFTTYTTNS